MPDRFYEQLITCIKQCSLSDCLNLLEGIGYVDETGVFMLSYLQLEEVEA